MELEASTGQPVTKKTTWNADLQQGGQQNDDGQNLKIHQQLKKESRIETIHLHDFGL